MPIDIKRNYIDREVEDNIAKKQEKREELDRMMKEFLAKGGKVEKLEPGVAADGGFTLNKDKRAQYSDAEIKKLAKENDGSKNSKDTGWNRY